MHIDPRMRRFSDVNDYIYRPSIDGVCLAALDLCVNLSTWCIQQLRIRKSFAICLQQRPQVAEITE